MGHSGRTRWRACDPGQLRRNPRSSARQRAILDARGLSVGRSRIAPGGWRRRPSSRNSAIAKSEPPLRGRFAPRSSARQRAIPDARGLSVGRSRIAPGSWRRGPSSRTQRLVIVSRMRDAVSLGVLPTLTPAASNASFLAAAVPDEPDTIAPACPMVLPSGAVKPAT